MLPLFFIISFILNSVGTVAVTYLVYYQYKYKGKTLYFLLISLLGLLCSGVSYSFFIVNLTSMPFERFKSVFFLFFSAGMLTFTVFFYFFLVRKFELRSYKTINLLLKAGYVLSGALLAAAPFIPVIWPICLIAVFIVLFPAFFLCLNQLWFLQSKLQFERRDISFRMLGIGLLLLGISVLGEIIHYLLYHTISDFSLVLYAAVPFFFIMVLKNQSLYYQKQEIENPEKIKTIFEQFNLSGKEQEIAMEVLQGKSNKEIAYDMDISSSTVKSHIYSIYKKVNVQSRVQFVNLVMLRM
jgi:DNA-binding CsgD family transcriptional regulator